MRSVAKLFFNGRSQAVRLPAAYRFESKEVYIRRDPDTGDVILSRKPGTWEDFFTLLKDVKIPADFMADKRRSAATKTEIILTDIRYMLDTNTASYAIKGNAAVRKHLLRTAMQQVCISVITETELLFGAARRPDNAGLKTAVQEFLLRVGILLWDSEAAYQYANLRSLLESKGKVIGNMDLLIAAHALATGVTLVTNDANFRHIQDLSLVNWSLGS